MPDLRVGIVDAQLFGHLGGLSGQVSSISQVLNVFKPDSLGQEETGDGGQDGDDGGGKDLLEHDLFVGRDETLPDGRTEFVLMEREAMSSWASFVMTCNAQTYHSTVDSRSGVELGVQSGIVTRYVLGDIAGHVGSEDVGGG